MKISVRDAARKHNVKYDALRWAALTQKQGFGLYRETVPMQPQPVLMMDDETEAFTSWLERYHRWQQTGARTAMQSGTQAYQHRYYQERTKQKRQSKNEFLNSSQISSENS